MAQTKIKAKTKFIVYKTIYSGRSTSDNIAWSNNCDSQELGLDSEFFIGSVTQAMTAALALLLHKKQVLNLDDPVHKFVKSKVDDFKSITIRDLLTHTSGIKNTPEGAELRKYSNVKAIIKQFGEEQLLVQERGTFNQSHLGYILLGAVIEKATGSTYYEVLEKYIAKPLKMTQTYIGKPSNNKLYRQGKLKIDRDEYKEIYFASSSAGLTSTIADLASFFGGVGEMLGKDMIPEFMKLHFCKHNGATITIQHMGAICGSEATLFATFDNNLNLKAFECKLATAVN